MPAPEIATVKQRFGIIGNSPLLARCLDIALQVSSTDLSVLITGESGVGKENFPQIIHQYSYRKHGPYFALNCGAIPEGTIDSELFGHEKGSFTGALSDRKGYFEVADHGTLFLDEVGELPLSTQARLLRVLETGEFIKVGSSKTLKTDVRVVAATNLDIPEAIRQGKFREDLYYRLNTVRIQVPALRERSSDILLLFRRFASDFAEKYRMPPIYLTDEAADMLTAYPFPGNIRQLKNITEQISVIEQNREISAATLKLYLPAPEVSTTLPSVVGGSSDRSFNSEREILYSVLFDMKKDMDELKKVVSHLMAQQVAHPGTTPVYPATTAINSTTPTTTSATAITLHDAVPTLPTQYAADEAIVPEVSAPRPTGSTPVSRASRHIQDTEEYVEETLSLADMERETIRRAIEKHHGRRRDAARELNISERTLYRKLKEYHLM